MARSARVTITVPAELKARMESHDKPVNWSAVASRAFACELAGDRAIVTDDGTVVVKLSIQLERASSVRAN
jgi:hypothetical protein